MFNILHLRSVNMIEVSKGLIVKRFLFLLTLNHLSLEGLHR